jgi:hypothetical protein
MSNKKQEKLGFLTVFTTKSESCDHYSYYLRTAKVPTEEQLEWWLKVNASDVDEETCYEQIDEIETINLDKLPDLVVLPKNDPAPEIDFM